MTTINYELLSESGVLGVVEDASFEEGWIYLEEHITMAMNKSIPKPNRSECQHSRSNKTHVDE